MIAAGTRDVLRLAWPAVLSVLLNNAYRVNDQYWVQGLGKAAQAAIGSSTFVLVMNFGLVYLAAGGALPLVARAAGANDAPERDSVARNALALGVGIALALGLAGSGLAPALPGVLGLEGEAARETARYLGTIYLGVLPLVLAPIVDSIFIALGNTRVPMALQVLAVSANFALNPLFIYGVGGWAGMGIAGAALATSLSRALSAGLGLLLLWRLYGLRPAARGAVTRARMAAVARLGLPMTLSILFYAGVYWAMLALVLSRLGTEAIAGLGIGFNAFEGVSFPFYLGIALAASSLVGRSLGAGEPESARLAIRSARRVGFAAGLGFALLFVVGRHALVPLFTDDPGVLKETLGYVGALAWSQLFVAAETVDEKALQGAGVTRPIFWISTAGNLLRIPLSFVLALPLGLSALGVWWAINATTLLKAALFRRAVDRMTRGWPDARGPGHGVASPLTGPRLAPLTAPPESPTARKPWRASR